MPVSWGYSPKIERYIPLADFPADKYLVVARQAIENLGWKLSHISQTGIIAYTPLSFQSYSEEISIRIAGNFAVIKSECVGIQLFFNDYGKNSTNLDLLFNEFEYVEYHLHEIWEETLQKFHEFIATQDDHYFEKAPLAVKNKIKNVFYLFYPQKGYIVTPLLINVNICYWILLVILTIVKYQWTNGDSSISHFQQNLLALGANNRELVLSGEYWRLITSQFLHLSLPHLFFNLYALAYLGLMVENKIGSYMFLFITISSGISGSLVSLIFHKYGIMLGASGAIMGLFGGFLALLLNNTFERNASKALLTSTILVSLLILLNGISGDIDNSAHLGGFISGFVMGNILFNYKLFIWSKPNSRLRLSFILLIVFASAVLLLTPNYQLRAFNKLQLEYDKNAFYFNKLYRIPPSTTRSERLHIITVYGIETWKSNIAVVEKMNDLKLDDLHQYRSRYNQSIAEKGLKISELLYKETNEDNSAYRLEINQLDKEVNELRQKARESGYKW
jgi:rhomboid protease GluP